MGNEWLFEEEKPDRSVTHGASWGNKGNRRAAPKEETPDIFLLHDSSLGWT